MIESLVEQIESRFADVQAQMADPEVIGDRRRYAEAGRLFNQLAPAAKLAEEWRHAQSDAGSGLASLSLRSTSLMTWKPRSARTGPRISPGFMANTISSIGFGSMSLPK